MRAESLQVHMVLGGHRSHHLQQQHIRHNAYQLNSCISCASMFVNGNNMQQRFIAVTQRHACICGQSFMPGQHLYVCHVTDAIVLISVMDHTNWQSGFKGRTLALCAASKIVSLWGDSVNPVCMTVASIRSKPAILCDQLGHMLKLTWGPVQKDGEITVEFTGIPKLLEAGPSAKVSSRRSC